jgi:hypothetical protein
MAKPVALYLVHSWERVWAWRVCYSMVYWAWEIEIKTEQRK